MVSEPARTPVLLLTATVALFLHYYMVRPDLIGVFSEARGWNAMTGPALSPLAHFAASALLLAAIPLVVARFACGVSIRDLGLGLGHWREGIIWLAIGVPLAVLSGWIASREPSIRAVYPLDPALAGHAGTFLPYAASAFLYYGAWEIMFRGVLLFGLRENIGDWGANSAQTAMSVTAHFGRSMTETFSAIPAGIVFGLVALRTRSVWYVAIIHWIVGMSTEWFSGTGAGV